MADPVLAFEGVGKAYPTEGGGTRWALRGATLAVEAGRKVAVVGRSGSGKSTLLHLAAGIDVPTEGTVRVAGHSVAGLSDAARTRLRRDTVGMVFQFFHLLPHLAVLDNVVLPALIAGTGRPEYEARARELLGRVGLADREGDAVAKLSGGEMQRVAICRALMMRPRLLLADEPTGNLDDATSRTVMDLLVGLVGEEGSALVYVTHSRELAELADRRLTLHSGVLEAEGPGPG